MKIALACLTVLALGACGVDGPPVRPSVKTTVGTGSKNGNASVTSDWISGNVSMHVGTSL
ncbi:argininosuccinate lyase [Roseovarius aestuarii]|nr:argininosuccinate lyase [Roseovarius aestuarii]